MASTVISTKQYEAKPVMIVLCFHMRKWRKAYRRVGRDRWRTACVLWLAAVKIGGGDGDAEQTWVVIWAMNRTQQERCRWVKISPKAPKICVVNVTYSCTSNSHVVCSDT